MIQFAIGAILGVAGYKALNKKLEKDPKFKEDFDSIVNDINEVFKGGVDFLSDAKSNVENSVNKNVFEKLFEKIKTAIKKETSEMPKAYQKYIKSSIKAIKKKEGYSFTGTKEIFKLYIQVLEEIEKYQSYNKID